MLDSKVRMFLTSVPLLMALCILAPAASAQVNSITVKNIPNTQAGNALTVSWTYGGSVHSDSVFAADLFRNGSYAQTLGRIDGGGCTSSSCSVTQVLDRLFMSGSCKVRVRAYRGNGSVEAESYSNGFNISGLPRPRPADQAVKTCVSSTLNSVRTRNSRNKIALVVEALIAHFTGVVVSQADIDALTTAAQRCGARQVNNEITIIR